MSTLVLEQRERDRRNGIIGTIVFHVLLALLFLFIGLKQPNPLPEEQGIELAFEEMGGLSGGQVAPAQGSPQRSTSTPAAPVEPDEVATEDDNPVEIPKPVKPKPKPQPNPKPETPKPPQPDPRALFIPSTSPSPSSNPGGTDTPGDRPGGGGSGEFKGKGFEGRLDGRGMGKGPTFTDRPPVDRRMVVTLFIFVDRNGNVTRTERNLDKSTTTRTDLFNIAAAGAKTMRFTARPDAPFEQRGEVSFVFEPE
jgi:hypothetical protein